MPRKFFRKFMPSPERVNSDRKLRMLRPLLNRPYLWHLNRHSVAKGVGIGTFFSMLPVYGQTVPALILAVRARANVPMAFVGLWLSNPITLVPHWWSAYIIGRWVMQRPPMEIEFSLEFLRSRPFSWYVENFWNFYAPLFVGSLIEGAVLGIGSFLIIMYGWRAHTQKRWRKSRERARKVQLKLLPEPVGV